MTEENGEESGKAPPRIFLSYAFNDGPLVQPVIDGLRQRGLDLVSPGSISAGLNYRDAILAQIRTADAFVVFITEASMRSAAVMEEIAAFRHAGGLQDRGVLIVGLQLDDTALPADLQSYLTIDLRGGREEGLDRLASRLKTFGEIDLSQLAPQSFELLVGDLLKAQGCQVTQIGQAASADSGFDLHALYDGRDPFGAIATSEWFVVVKHYRRGRLSVAALNELTARASSLPKHALLLVVTSGSLTSVAREFLRALEQEAQRTIRVIDRPELTALLLRAPAVAEKYHPRAFDL